MIEESPGLVHAWQDYLVARIHWEERSGRGISPFLVKELAWTAFRLVELEVDRGDGRPAEQES